MIICFSQCSFVLRVGAVIFDIDEVSMSNFVKYEFLSMTLTIERVFEKRRKNIVSQKLGKRP